MLMKTAPVNPNHYLTNRRQLYILPTRGGIMFGIMLLAMFGLAIRFQSQPAFLMTFLLAALGQVSALYTHRNILGLKLSAHDPKPITAGQKAKFKVTIENSTDQARHDLWLIPNLDPQATQIEAYSSADTFVTIASKGRGWLDCPSFSVTSHYPMALLYSWSRKVKPSKRCLVYPKAVGNLPIPTHLGISGDGGSAIAGAQGEYFHSVRPFQSGDGMQHIHWRASAKLQKPMTKQYERAVSNTLWLAWDALGLLETETRICQLARWVIDATEQRLDFGLLLPDKQIEPGSGEHHMHTCLKALALY
jgi:uncharacterized protein (DUF58 family)